MNSKKKYKILRTIYAPFLYFLLALIICMVIMPLIVRIISTDETIKIIDSLNYKNKVETPSMVEIYDTTSSKVINLPLEEYIKCVVSCEMPSTFHEEALKAQAVAARTYAVSRILSSENNGNPEMHKSAPLCNTTHCQVYKSIQDLEKAHGRQWMDEGFSKISDAVNSTAGELLYYNGKLVKQALFHSSSGGATENSEDVFSTAVPYLVSVDSPYESKATHKNEKTQFSLDEFADEIKKAYPDYSFGDINSNTIKIIKRTNGNRVAEILIGEQILTGRQVREALNLPSANFTINTKNNIVTIVTNGSGHGVGMSQYGANGMAEIGFDYKKILSHYYSGTEIY